MGYYYGRAVTGTQNLKISSLSSALSCFSLIFLQKPYNILIALFVLLFINDFMLSVNDFMVTMNVPPLNCSENFKNKNNRSSCNDLCRHTSSTIKSAIVLSGDIESNPGPRICSELSIIHLNARSIKHKLDLIEAESQNLDIVTVSETWLSSSVSNNDILIHNFLPPIRCDRRNDPHGGVAIYVKNTIHCRARPDLHVPNLEAVWVEIRLNQEGILIGSFYRPPNSSVDYWRLIRDSIRKADSTTLNYFILGDFNTDFLNCPSVHLLDIIDRFDLHQLINEPTRVADSTSTCLDLILTQNQNIVKSVCVLSPVYI